ncbi:MAG: glycosyltransferase family 9 protein [Bacteroidetes bacterium]|nr:glycosyltransferase family 9 protein [Bacteroidota bacterium]MCH7770358.1 glycosyltransferase family 9 protein [Bacteroidota bacterium]
MAKNSFITRSINSIFRKLLAVEENKSLDIGNPRKIIIVRQHNQLGDLLAGVSLFRALKETHPECHITLIVSPFNYPGMIKNKYIDRIFVFDKKKIINPIYFNLFFKLLKEKYDLAIVPVVVSISFTSNLIARLSNSKIRIGPNSLDGIVNESAYFFDRRITLDWRSQPDSNVYERSLDIIRQFGINTKVYNSEVSFDDDDMKNVQVFLNENNFANGTKLVGLHVGAGKQPNRWSLNKYTSLINKLNKEFNTSFYLTGSKADEEEINFLIKEVDFKIGLFINRSISEVAALISKSNLFITNDTGIMHVAGATNTPQISVFGPTNPFNWAPFGTQKYFIRKSELIEDVAVDDVFQLCRMILNKEQKL